ncbi:GntR family transcriptional regulator / MocR family aminotransferase [Parafrankia irregularis]|uniref:GntR family transcriptional regulator / MocR family aminotransferase n=1 Tax=Parafrankia irregularis TaxID=795642 RepID=A0A0S4QPI3_9ACTN|nr:GntR family transcriptional regulator / MocR family aminotransferase [Parafrankia irregularis]
MLRSKLVTISWVKPGPYSFLVDLDPKLGRRAALEAGLRDAIRAGRLRPGARLPSSRILAAELGVSRGTISTAYTQLVSEGFLVSSRGGGSRVADLATGGAEPKNIGPRSEKEASALRWDFRPGEPDLTSFPRSEWQNALREILRTSPASFLGYQDPQGVPELRSAVADHLRRSRNLAVDTENIVICAGFRQGLDLICRVLRDAGTRTVALEDPGLADHHRVAGASLNVVSLPVDALGADTRRLWTSSAQAVVLTPSHQFPLGVRLHPDRRAEAFAWARRTNGLIIEDDYDGEFLYDGGPLGAMQGEDPDRVAYIGSVSKTLAPGIRLGWLVLPPHLISPVCEAKYLSDAASGSFDQKVLASMLRSGAFATHLRKRRVAYRQRRDHMVGMVAERVPGATVRGIAAGLHAVIELPAGVQAGWLQRSAARRGLGIGNLDSYRIAGEQADDAVVLAYGRPPSHSFTRGIAEFVDLVPG